MKAEIQHVYACIDTWKQQIDLSRSGSDMDAADDWLATKLADALARYPIAADTIDAALQTVGANDLLTAVRLLFERLTEETT